MSKAHLLELSEEGFGRRAAVQAAVRAGSWTRHALVTPGKSTLPAKGKAAIVPPPQVALPVEAEEQPLTVVPLAEATALEVWHMAELEHEIAVAELEHDTPLAEESRLEVSDMSGLESGTAIGEVPEVPRCERPRVAQGAAVAELEAIVSQVQLRASMP